MNQKQPLFSLQKLHFNLSQLSEELLGLWSVGIVEAVVSGFGDFVLDALADTLEPVHMSFFSEAEEAEGDEPIVVVRVRIIGSKGVGSLKAFNERPVGHEALAEDVICFVEGFFSVL